MTGEAPGRAPHRPGQVHGGVPASQLESLQFLHGQVTKARRSLEGRPLFGTEAPEAGLDEGQIASSDHRRSRSPAGHEPSPSRFRSEVRPGSPGRVVEECGDVDSPVVALPAVERRQGGRVDFSADAVDGRGRWILDEVGEVT
jgi:hypothetical protein